MVGIAINIFLAMEDVGVMPPTVVSVVNSKDKNVGLGNHDVERITGWDVHSRIQN